MNTNVIGPSGKDVFGVAVLFDHGSSGDTLCFHTQAFMVEAISREEARGIAYEIATKLQQAAGFSQILYVHVSKSEVASTDDAWVIRRLKQ